MCLESLEENDKTIVQWPRRLWYIVFEREAILSEQDVEVAVVNNEPETIVTPEAVNVVEPDENIIDTSLGTPESWARRLLRKPYIDHLPDAIVTTDDGMPVLVPLPGETVVIERMATIVSGSPWLDTKLYKIVSVDEDTGVVKLWSQEDHAFGFTNYIRAWEDKSQRFKLPPEKGSWSGSPEQHAKAIVEAAKPAPPDGKKRGRGRPPGSKNRAKDVINAEKKEKREKTKEKRQRRHKRK